jgi:murein DD-endopeptidase MepM/ murein hydrolase activator NlpD
VRLGLPGRIGRSGRARAAPAAREGLSLEVQIHPGDIRKRVHYLFLSRAQVISAAVLLLVYLLGLAVAVAVAPGVFAGMLSGEEYRSLAIERARQGERLQALSDHLCALRERADALHLRLAKVYLAYGLLPRPPAATERAPVSPLLSMSKSIYAGAVDQGLRQQGRLTSQLQRLDVALGGVQAYERDHRDRVRTTPAVCPLRGGQFVLVSPFGNRRSPFTRDFEFHAGLDLAAREGTPIRSPADGVVAFAGRYPQPRSVVWWRLGNLVIVRNGDDFVTLYGHCERILVRPGQGVRRGDPLATVGSTGWSTSSHLHYEIRRRGADRAFRPVDPMVFILDRRWPNEERLIVRARSAAPTDFEPLPPGLVR